MIDIPAAAKVNTEDGAVAFVRFWFEQVNVAFTRPNPDLIPTLSASSCKSCASLAEHPVGFAAKGYRVQPAPFRPLTNVKSLGLSTDGTRIAFTLSQGDADVVDRSGKVVDTQKADSVERVALVARKGNQWLMAGLASPTS
ncbi:DUF6318 family protein [Knoellia sp. S7-12]|uniref:DUF6318 family protein n=1 Tax=Knoellia sp. S7-12 TaxID=3126698 RepID=UPI003368A63C